MRIVTCRPQQLDRLDVPVVQDKKRPLTGLFARTPLPTTFSFSLDDALAFADRHMVISGQPKNVTQLVEDWVSIQHWEVNAFWEVDGKANWLGANTRNGYAFTSEHSSRSGELLAEGVAIHFLTTWLRLGGQAMEFIRATGARPDYAFRRARLYTPTTTYGMEVRLRKSPDPLSNGKYRDYLTKKDWGSLENKKKASNMAAVGVSGIVGVYLFYGHTNRAKLGCQTRIHLADPVFHEIPTDMNEAAKVLADYYIGVTSRLGLWEYRNVLESMRAELNFSAIAPVSPVGVTRLRSSLPRTIGDQVYLCREFSSIQMLADTGHLAEAVEYVRRGDFGYVTYHGVNQAVLDHVLNTRWNDALEFYDPNTGSVVLNSHDGHVTSDGVLKCRFEVEPGSQEAVLLQTQFG